MKFHIFRTSLVFLNHYEVDNLLYLTLGSRVVGLLGGVTDLLQTQRISGSNLILLGADQALNQFNLHLAASLQNLFYGLAANTGNLFRGAQSAQTLESRANDVAGVVGAESLCTDVLDADCLNNGTNGTARDNAGTGSGRLHQNSAGAVCTDDLVRNGCALEGYGHEVLFSVLDSLADRVGNFTGLADTEAYDAVAVADDYESRELHDTAALYGLTDTVDRDNALGQLQC